MHRDRIRWLLNNGKAYSLDGARELVDGLPSILLQLDAAKKFIDEQSDENSAELLRLLDAH